MSGSSGMFISLHVVHELLQPRSLDGEKLPVSVQAEPRRPRRPCETPRHSHIAGRIEPSVVDRDQVERRTCATMAAVVSARCRARTGSALPQTTRSDSFRGCFAPLCPFKLN